MNVESKYLTSYYAEIAEVNLFAFLYRLFHEWREIFTKQSVDKCKWINFYNLCVQSSPLSTLPRVIPEHIWII